jgi:hypothetical protein
MVSILTCHGALQRIIHPQKNMGHLDTRNHTSMRSVDSSCSDCPTSNTGSHSKLVVQQHAVRMGCSSKHNNASVAHLYQTIRRSNENRAAATTRHRWTPSLTHSLVPYHPRVALAARLIVVHGLARVPRASLPSVLYS